METFRFVQGAATTPEALGSQLKELGFDRVRRLAPMRAGSAIALEYIPDGVWHALITGEEPLKTTVHPISGTYDVTSVVHGNHEHRGQWLVTVPSSLAALSHFSRLAKALIIALARERRDAIWFAQSTGSSGHSYLLTRMGRDRCELSHARQHFLSTGFVNGGIVAREGRGLHYQPTTGSARKWTPVFTAPHGGIVHAATPVTPKGKMVVTAGNTILAMDTSSVPEAPTILAQAPRRGKHNGAPYDRMRYLGTLAEGAIVVTERRLDDGGATLTFWPRKVDPVPEVTEALLS